eukprot:scaffold114321_cov44-Phaeocystis_antarctica.AAC.3
MCVLHARARRNEAISTHEISTPAAGALPARFYQMGAPLGSASAQGSVAALQVELVSPHLGGAVNVDGDELELRGGELGEMRREVLAQDEEHVDEAEDHRLAHVGVLVLEGVEERRQHLRQDGQELHGREAANKLGL